MKAFWENFFNFGTFIVVMSLIGIGERYMASQVKIEEAKASAPRVVQCNCTCNAKIATKPEGFTPIDGGK